MSSTKFSVDMESIGGSGTISGFNNPKISAKENHGQFGSNGLTEDLRKYIIIHSEEGKASAEELQVETKGNGTSSDLLCITMPRDLKEKLDLDSVSGLYMMVDTGLLHVLFKGRHLEPDVDDFMDELEKKDKQISLLNRIGIGDNRFMKLFHHLPENCTKIVVEATVQTSKVNDDKKTSPASIDQGIADLWLDEELKQNTGKISSNDSSSVARIHLDPSRSSPGGDSGQEEDEVRESLMLSPAGEMTDSLGSEELTREEMAGDDSCGAEAQSEDEKDESESEEDNQSEVDVNVVQIGHNQTMDVQWTAGQIVNASQEGWNNTMMFNIVPSTTASKVIVVLTTNPGDTSLESLMVKEFTDETECINVCMEGLGATIVKVWNGSVVMEIEVKPGVKIDKDYIQKLMNAIFGGKAGKVIPEGTKFGVDIQTKMVIPLDQIGQYVNLNPEKLHENCVSKEKYEEKVQEVLRLQRIVARAKAPPNLPHGLPISAIPAIPAIPPFYVSNPSQQNIQQPALYPNYEDLQQRLPVAAISYNDMSGVPGPSTIGGQDRATLGSVPYSDDANTDNKDHDGEDVDDDFRMDVEDDDFKTLSQSIKKRDFMKTKLEVLEVPHTSCVTVRQLPDNVTEENIDMYFENKKRSQGGTVEEVILNKEDSSAVVKFTESSVAERVCKHGHELEKSRVEVCLHFECLGESGGSPEKPCAKIPDPVEVKKIDRHVLQFLNAQMQAMESVKNAVVKSFGQVEIDQTNEAIKLSPTFTKEDKNAKKIAKTWTNDVKKTLLECLDTFEVEEVKINEEIWADIEPKINFPNQPDVHVLTEEHNLIVIVGQKGKITDKVAEVKKIRATVQEDYDRRKNQVRLHKSFDVGKLKLLSAKGILPEKREYVAIQCNLQTGEVEFLGPENDVQQVLMNVLEMMTSVSEQKSSEFTNDMLELMRRPTVFQFLDEKQKNHLSWTIATWIADTQEVKIYFTNGGFQKMVQFLNDSIQERVVRLDNENVPLLSTKGFQAVIEEIQRERGRVVVSPRPQQRRIHITAVTEDLDSAVQTVDNYIQTNSVYVLELQYSLPVSEFIFHHCKSKLDSISEDLKQYLVRFEFERSGSTQKIVLKATKKGKDQARMFLDPIAGGVKCHEEVLTKIGIENFLDTSDVLKHVQKNTRCIIKRTPPTAESGLTQAFNSGVDCETAFTCNPRGNKTVTVVVGEYVTMAAKVEAIVVETTPELKTDTAQASSVITRAGEDVVLDARRSHLYEGDIHSTSSGLLPRSCKRIIFAVGPDEGTRGDPGSVLKAVVSSSIEEASKNRGQSIALPSFDLPSVRRSMSADDKFRYILEGIKEYFQDNPTTGVDDVFLCLSDTQQCQAVWSQATSVFGQDKVVAKNAEKPVGHEPERYGTRHNRRSNSGRTRKPLYIPEAREAVQEEVYTDTRYGADRSDDVQLEKPRILLVKQDMGKEEADVIVSSSNNSLDLSRGMVSKSLLKHAGNSIQEECKVKYPDGIKAGEIAVTKGGEMQCVEQIYHCVLPNYDANTGQQVLVDTLNLVLLKAHEAKWKSIAIPALGTGNLGYSRDLVAKTMYETVTQFGKDHPETTLNDVLFIVYPGDKESCQVFEAENKKHVEARGGKVAASQEEIDTQREMEMVGYREKLIRDKEIRDKESPQPQARPQSSGGIFSGISNWWSGKKNPQEAPDFSTLKTSSSSADVTLWIYTDDESQVTAARNMIIKTMQGEEEERKLDEPGLKVWSDNQIKKLTDLQHKHGVTIKVNKKMGRIIIVGLVNNLSEAHTDIMQIIRAVDNALEEQKYAEEVQKVVQWYYQEEDQGSVPYETLINAKLEKAFNKKNESNLVLDGFVYDFKDLVEYPVSDKSDTVKIMRKDFLEAGSTKPPDTWDDTAGDIAVVKLDKGTPEYQQVEKNITDSFATKPVEIVRIDRVQNKTLYHQYKAKCHHLERQNPGVTIEKTLWHGTKSDNAMNINNGGFNRSHCDKSQCKYGEGVYFTTTAPAAADDTYAPAGSDNKRVIFQSKVLTGKYALGNQDYRVPPQRGGNKTDLYDSVVDDVNAPTVFVIFSDTQAYPEYLITIKC